MIYHYSVREIGPSEYHVIEQRFVSEPEYVIARCTGLVPADQIAQAMRLYRNVGTVIAQLNSIESSVRLAKEQFKRDQDDITLKYPRDERVLLIKTQPIIGNTIQREHDAKIAEDHSKNCGACGCDGQQIANKIRSTSVDS